MGLFDSIRGALQGSGGVSRIDVDARFDRSRTAATGTMSHFFAAQDRVRKEVVGVKILDPEKYELFESRFKGLGKPSEGEIAISMRHPLIAETYEHGVTTKGQRVLVMEYVSGPGMQDIIVRKKGDVIEGKHLQLMRQMAESLAYVHSQDYIHRDVCPRNFICLPDISGVKLIDFGLTVPATPPFMAPGNRTGTPLYMSPEIVRRRHTDKRVDVFSLGVTFYCLLTFTHPWQGEVVTGRAALQHDTRDPTEILERRGDIEPKLARVIMRMIDPKVDSRLGSIEEFLQQTRTLKSAFTST
ncbi:MAG: serine/threonine-protein kinase [Planctomycetota bacterium]